MQLLQEEIDPLRPQHFFLHPMAVLHHVYTTYRPDPALQIQVKHRERGGWNPHYSFILQDQNKLPPPQKKKQSEK